jgi:hypothetical protein
LWPDEAREAQAGGEAGVRPLIVSGSWFVPVSVALLTFNAGMLLLHGWEQFGWFKLAALSLIAGVTVKMLIDSRKKEPK